jgi:hypothetical protein
MGPPNQSKRGIHGLSSHFVHTSAPPIQVCPDAKPPRAAKKMNLSTNGALELNPSRKICFYPVEQISCSRPVSEQPKNLVCARWEPGVLATVLSMAAQAHQRGGS